MGRPESWPSLRGFLPQLNGTPVQTFANGTRRVPDFPAQPGGRREALGESSLSAISYAITRASL